MFLLTIFITLEKPHISLPEGEQFISNKILPTTLNFSDVFNSTNSFINSTSTTIEPTLYVNTTEEEFKLELESDHNSSQNVNSSQNINSTRNINPKNSYNFSEPDAKSNSSVKSKKKLTKGYLSQNSYSDTKSIVLVVTGSVLFAAGVILAITTSYRRRKGYNILNSTHTNTHNSYGSVDN